MANKRGVALVFSFIIIVVLIVLSAAIVTRSVSEGNLARRHQETTQAFWLAEAGVNRALSELGTSFSSTGNGLWTGTLQTGSYSVDVSNIMIGAQTCKQVVSHGFVPAVQPRVERIISAVMRKYIPPNFYSHAIYSADDVTFKGTQYSVTGDVVRADELILSGHNTPNVTGTVSTDTAISPLARLDFVQLYAISLAQGNVYDADRLKDVGRGRDAFPTSFWYTPPTDPSDPTTGFRM